MWDTTSIPRLLTWTCAFTSLIHNSTREWTLRLPPIRKRGSYTAPQLHYRRGCLQRRASNSSDFIVLLLNLHQSWCPISETVERLIAKDKQKARNFIEITTMISKRNETKPFMTAKFLQTALRGNLQYFLPNLLLCYRGRVWGVGLQPLSTPLLATCNPIKFGRDTNRLLLVSE